jgi:hypothetical protein
MSQGDRYNSFRAEKFLFFMKGIYMRNWFKSKPNPVRADFYPIGNTLWKVDWEQRTTQGVSYTPEWLMYALYSFNVNDACNVIVYRKDLKVGEPVSIMDRKNKRLTTATLMR